MNVAPKKSQNGMRKWPQQMPHRSKAALGQAANRRIPMNPCLHNTLLGYKTWGNRVPGTQYRLGKEPQLAQAAFDQEVRQDSKQHHQQS